MILLVFAMLYTKEGFVVANCNTNKTCRKCNDVRNCRWNRPANACEDNKSEAKKKCY